MRHMSFKRLLPLVLALSLLSLSPISAIAQTKDDVERADRAADVALGDLRTVNRQLEAALTEYHTVNGELEDLTFRVALLIDRVTDYESEARELRQHAEDLVVQAYVRGSVEIIEVALTAETIQDILLSQIILDRAAGSDLTSANRLEVVRREMGRLKTELGEDQERVAELRATAEVVVAQLDTLQREAAAAYENASENAASALSAYKAEQARLAAIEAARASGPAAGVDDLATPGFLCPVEGGGNFINDWGFPRSGGRTHKGTDMFAPRGTPVVAVGDGVVTLRDYDLGGIAAFVRADHGATYYYAHLDAYAPGIANGQRISRGDVIGFVGNTGNAIATSPHLHFQVHPNHGAAVNPYPTLRRHC